MTFTGSAAVGSKILTLAAPTLKKVVLELGGKSPNIVLPGTDIEKAVPASALRFTRNSGQACGATTRTLVPQADFDEYVERSGKFPGGLTVGDPHHPDTVLGPLITGEHRGNVEGFLARAREAGAEIPVGGGRPPGLDDGFFLEPTLVTGISNDAEIAQEELFAPVGVVMPYTDLDDAFRMANDVKYALNANVWPHPRRSRVRSSPAVGHRHRQRRWRHARRRPVGWTRAQRNRPRGRRGGISGVLRGQAHSVACITEANVTPTITARRGRI